MRKFFSVLIAMSALLVGCGTSAPSNSTDPAYRIAVEVFANSPYQEPLGSNVTWRTAIPTMGGEEFGGMADSNRSCIGGYCTNWVVTIHPDYLRRDVVAHEGGHVICWARWMDSSEACADRIMHELT